MSAFNCFCGAGKMLNMRTLRYLLSVSTLMLTAAPMPGQDVSPTAAQASGNSTGATPQPQLQDRFPRYAVARQDVLLVTFPLSPELNQTITVQPDGYINLQSAGSIHVQGLTVPQTVDAIKLAYTGILNNPIVAVDLEDFQKPYFTVSGQVGKPGQYELRSDTTLAEALAVAGGLSSTSKTQVFLFHRTSAEWFKVEKFNMKDVFTGKNINEDPRIQPGDMVFVPENAITKFRKYVPYGVNAGSYVSETP